MMHGFGSYGEVVQEDLSWKNGKTVIGLFHVSNSYLIWVAQIVWVFYFVGYYV